MVSVDSHFGLAHFWGLSRSECLTSRSNSVPHFAQRYSKRGMVGSKVEPHHTHDPRGSSQPWRGLGPAPFVDGSRVGGARDAHLRRLSRRVYRRGPQGDCPGTLPGLNSESGFLSTDSRSHHLEPISHHPPVSSGPYRTGEPNGCASGGCWESAVGPLSYWGTSAGPPPIPERVVSVHGCPLVTSPVLLG